MVIRTRPCSPQVEPISRILDETERVRGELGVDRQTAVSLLVVDKLEQLTQAVIEPPRTAANVKEVLVTVVTVVTAGTPVQGPSIVVPRGYPTIVRQRRHTGPTRSGYVAFERSDTANSRNRMEFRDNDSISLPLEGLDSLWFDADNNDTSFELIVAYGRRQVD